MKKNNLKVKKWKKIWNNRNLSFNTETPTIIKLMILNGHYDSINKINLNDWKKYGKNIIKKLKIKRNESIFEFGCGSGALLYLFKSKTNRLFGCDYSKQLVKLSKKIVPELKIFYSDSENYKSYKIYDHVISSSMLEYVKSNKIKKIITNMINSFSKGLFIGEILDKKYEKKFLEKFGKPKNYYTFINKKLFKDFCKSKNLKLKIYPSIMPGTKQKKFRYCVQINK